MTNTKYSKTETAAKDYYNSSEADQFYSNIWGGEDIHIGLHDNPRVSIIEASRRTIELMAVQLKFNRKIPKLIDLGSGYGGSARYLVENYDYDVTCLNISDEQNKKNRNINKEQDFESKIEVVDGSFESIPFEDGLFDFAWSQDALFHSNKKEQVLQEVYRILKKGGEFIFSDPMQKEGVTKDQLNPFLEATHLESLGSIDLYLETAAKIGFAKLNVLDLTENLGRHYKKILEEVEKRYAEMEQISNKDFMNKTKVELENWVDASKKGYLSWGILHLKKL